MVIYIKNRLSKKNYNLLAIIIERFGIISMLVILSIIFGIFVPRFFTLQNFTNISMQAVPIGFLALGLMFVLISGGIDLTAGIGVSLAAVVMNFFFILTRSATLAIMFGFLSVLLLGAINGLLISKARFQSIIVTLIMMTITLGIVFIIYNLSPETLNISNLFFKFIARKRLVGIPASFVIMSFVYFISYIVLNHTRFGLYLLAIGGNQEGARITGIKIDKYIFYTYVISGFFMGLSSLILVARVSYITPRLGGTSLLLDTLAAIIIGGVLISGGKGTIQGVLIGTLSITIINNMVSMVDIHPAWNDFFKGIVIILMMLFNRMVSILEETRI